MRTYADRVSEMKLIPLTQGKFSKIDDEDIELVIDRSWSAKLNGRVWYAETNIAGGGSLQMQCVILDSGRLEIDHKDGDGLNNQRSNLRIATHQQNCGNRRISKNNTSGFKGVRKYRHYNKYVARIRVNYRAIHLGYFDDPISAAIAYNRAAKHHFGEFARLNEIP